MNFVVNSTVVVELKVVLEIMVVTKTEESDAEAVHVTASANVRGQESVAVTDLAIAEIALDVTKFTKKKKCFFWID